MKTLTKEFGYLSADYTAATNTWAIDGTNTIGEWRLLPAAAGVFVSSNYIDLTGLSMEDKTIFFEAIATQQSSVESVANMNAGQGMVVYDLITSIPVTDTEILAATVAGFGMLGTTLNFEHVIYCRTLFLRADIDFAQLALVPFREFQTGSLQATASDRLYCYRIAVSENPQADGALFMPSARYVLRVNAVEEPTYEHIMRLKRSYDLQQTDRD